MVKYLHNEHSPTHWSVLKWNVLTVRSLDVLKLYIIFDIIIFLQTLLTNVTQE